MTQEQLATKTGTISRAAHWLWIVEPPQTNVDRAHPSVIQACLGFGYSPVF